MGCNCGGKGFRSSARPTITRASGGHAPSMQNQSRIQQHVSHAPTVIQSQALQQRRTSNAASRRQV